MSENRLDLTSDAQPTPPQEAKAERPFLGVNFQCCGAYARIYQNRAGTAYEGRCPKCAKPIRFAIGPGGESGRFFNAS